MFQDFKSFVQQDRTKISKEILNETPSRLKVSASNNIRLDLVSILDSIYLIE